MPWHDHNEEYPRFWVIESMAKRIDVLEKKIEALCRHQKITFKKTEFIVKDEASHQNKGG